MHLFYDVVSCCKDDDHLAWVPVVVLRAGYEALNGSGSTDLSLSHTGGRV